MRRLRDFLDCRFVFSLMLIASPCLAQLDSQNWLDASSWTDVSGKFRIEATFVRIDQQNVILKKSDGKEIPVPLSKLSEESRKRALDAAKKTPTTALPSTKSSSSNAASSKAPALNVAPSKAPIAIPSNLDAKQFVEFVVQQAKEGKGIVFWDALPAKYQQDIESVVKLAAEKTDPSLVQPVIQIQSDLIKVLRTKKTFVLNTPMVKDAMKDVFKDDNLANTCYDPMVDLVEAYLPTDLLNHQRLKKGNLRPVLESYLTRVAQKAASLEAAVPKDGPAYAMAKSARWENFKYEVESVSSDSATLIMKPENKPEQRVELVNVEGRWLPKAMVADWDKNIGQAKQSLEKLSPQEMAQAKQAMQMPMMMASGVVGGFLAANDQASFDQALMSVMPMLSMVGGMPGMPMQGMPPAAP